MRDAVVAIVGPVLLTLPAMLLHGENNGMLFLPFPIVVIVFGVVPVAVASAVSYFVAVLPSYKLCFTQGLSLRTVLVYFGIGFLIGVVLGFPFGVPLWAAAFVWALQVCKVTMNWSSLKQKTPADPPLHKDSNQV